MALFFAAHRWGDGEGIFNYSKQAKDILKACLHKGENGRQGEPMWNRENHQILFVPGIDFTDPSYHLPHFYELFAMWSYEEDRGFWKQAAKASREYLVKACRPDTGFSPEYAEFDGRAMTRKLPWTDDRHDWFFSDSYRTVANIGLDYEWFGIDEGQCMAAKAIQRFLLEDKRRGEYYIYELDGRAVPNKALHPIAIPATVAMSTLAATTDCSREWVESFWSMSMRSGKWRYYDNCLYFFAFLALSGNYRIW
jgi:oligosaccharide reducing-end xylanase